VALGWARPPRLKKSLGGRRPPSSTSLRSTLKHVEEIKKMVISILMVLYVCPSKISEEHI